MRNRILRALVLFIIFCAGVFVFSNLMNSQVTESASDLSDSTLPVVCVNIGGNRVNRMYGFKHEMLASEMRDSLIPMTTDREITLSYKANGNRVQSVSYEVTAPDTGAVIENAKIGNFTTDGEYRTASFTLSEPILMNREYPIRFTVSTANGDVYYYSRLLQRADLVTEKYVQFVYDFYETSMNKNGAGELNTYLETDNTVSNNSFTTVDIKSTLDQVTWGSLNPQVYRRAIPSIREINANTCSITTDYLIRAVNRSKTEYYHVWEFYRLRYYNDRMMLLDFNRRALQVFDGSSGSITSDGISLGVAMRGTEYMTNSSSEIVAFVQDNALWEFNQSAEKLACVFTFHDISEGSDERDDHDDYGIRIIRVSESGDIDFVVYGYMNSGRHEGEMGVWVLHYTSEGTVIEERAFISYPKSYMQLANDVKKLLYVNNEGVVYVYLSGSVYRVSTFDGTCEEIISDIHPDCFIASGSQDQIAWANEMDPDRSKTITVMNLTNGATRRIDAETNGFIRPIGFINSDLIYALAREPDIQVQPAGNVIFAMHELRIEDVDGVLVKTYEPENCFVTDVSIKEGLVELTRMEKTDAGYQPITTDNIMNNRQTASSKISIGVGLSTRQGAVVTLRMPQAVRNLEPLVAMFRERTNTQAVQANPEITVDHKTVRYFVYAGGGLVDVYADPGAAIREADARVGVVVNQEGQYIYERGNSLAENELFNEDIPAPMLSGGINASVIAQALGEEGTVMNLTGCTLSQVLYEVSNGRPVIARLANGDITVIVGYNRYNTRLYNYEDGSHYWMGINDSTNSFLAGGNVFVSCVQPQRTVKG